MRAWAKWSLVGCAVLAILAACVIGAGLWYVAGQVSADVRVGQPLPAVMLADFEGRLVELASFRSRPVLLDFWNSR